MLIELAPEISMEFIHIPAGKFLMGVKKSDKYSHLGEQPQHKVYLDDYYIGRTPVTNKQYFVYASETDCERPNHWKDGKIPYTADNHPVLFCSWMDAVGFCNWANIKSGYKIRLPTEAEWEKAARGTDGRHYPWGNHYDWEKGDRRKMHSSWNQMKGSLRTHEVGSFPEQASPYGCDDMACGIGEWINDWYDQKYYILSPNKNPKGQTDGIYRVIRNWTGAAEGGRLLLSTNRYRELPDSRIYGFRCAFSLP